MANKHWWLNLAKDELKVVVALAMVLAVFLGLSYAQTTQTAFDLGLRTSVAAGDVLVEETSAYPRSNTAIPGVSFGFVNTSDLITNNDAEGSTRLQDSLGSASAKTFRLTGLEAGSYRLTFYARRTGSSVSTAVESGSQRVTLQAASNQTAAKSLIISANAGEVNFILKPLALPTWTLNYFTLEKTTTPEPVPSFTLTVGPTEQSAPAGSVVEYRLTVNPVNNYNAEVAFGIASLPSGITAEFTPAAITTLPGTSQLLLRVDNSVPPLGYSLRVTATGNDTGRTTQSVVIRLNVRPQSTDPTPLPEPSPDPLPTDPAPVEPTPEVTLTREQIRQNLAVLEQSHESVVEATLDAPQRAFLGFTGTHLEGFGTVAPPDSAGVLGSALDSLVEGDTINVVVDAAPIDPNSFGDTGERTSAFGRLLRFLFGARQTQ